MGRERRVNVTLEFTTEPTYEQVGAIRERVHEAVVDGVTVTGWVGVADVGDQATMLSEAEMELGELNALGDPYLRFAARPILELTDVTTVGADPEPAR